MIAMKSSAINREKMEAFKERIYFYDSHIGCQLFIALGKGGESGLIPNLLHPN